jgi:hypothetical protein
LEESLKRRKWRFFEEISFYEHQIRARNEKWGRQEEEGMKRIINGRIKIPGSLFPCIACIFIVINSGGFLEPTSNRIFFVCKFYIPPRRGNGWLVAYSTALASGLRISTPAIFVVDVMVPRYSG